MDLSNFSAPNTPSAELQVGPSRCKYLIAACETCFGVNRVPSKLLGEGVASKSACSICGGTLNLPTPLLRFLALCGYFVPEETVVSLVSASIGMDPTLLPHYVAAAANMVFAKLASELSYDVAIARGHEELMMKLVRHGNCLIVDDFIHKDDIVEGPAERTRLIYPGDTLIAVNKQSLERIPFDDQVTMLSQSPSPIFLTFKRGRPIHILR